MQWMFVTRMTESIGCSGCVVTDVFCWGVRLQRTTAMLHHVFLLLNLEAWSAPHRFVCSPAEASSQLHSWEMEEGRGKLTLWKRRMQVWEAAQQVMNPHLLLPSENWCHRRGDTWEPGLLQRCHVITEVSSPAYCLLVSLWYPSGPLERRKNKLASLRVNWLRPLPQPLVVLLIMFS